MILAVIRIMEREGPESDYITETGRGFPDTLEYHEVDAIAVTDQDLDEAVETLGDCSLDDLIQGVLDSVSLSQWDGGNVAYDPDGTRPNHNRGTRIERYASIRRTDLSAYDFDQEGQHL